jgi:protein-L-isoaspartate(D-aspartate) O-methyltransferase
MSQPDTDSEWCQVSLWCEDWQAAEHLAVARLGPRLIDAQDEGIIMSWWYVRKAEAWRVRYLPAPCQQERATTAMEQTMLGLAADGLIQRWASPIYEPEIQAFGGVEGMALAHALFHADSRHLLDHLRQSHPEHRAELGLLLGSVLIRAAGQDWYEQGDVWARVAGHRLSSTPPLTDMPFEAVRQLITATTNSPNSPLASAPDWSAAFHRAGRGLVNLADQGSLTRGLRAVLAHQILFAWNRAGIPASQQGLLAATAARVVFQTEPAHVPSLLSALATSPKIKVDPMTTDSTPTPDAAQLRAGLADYIRGLGTFRTPQVEAAFRTVPRHLFLPSVDLVTAYAPQVVITKRAEDGSALSSASHPNLVASMLEELDVQPGHRVLEIGAATGINAALLAELVGPTGTVLTIEIDDDLAAGARTALTAAGYDQVEVICGDGAGGHPAAGPYDRIIVTAGAWDLASAWWQQLSVDGRVVVPLRLHGSGLTRSITFDLREGRMVSSTAQVCGFVPMRGTGAHAGHSIQLADEVVLNLDADSPADVTALSQAFGHPAHELWTGIVIHDDEPVEHLDLWLTTITPCFGRLSIGSTARESGLANPALRWAGAALYDSGTIAYITLRPITAESDELGIVAHGPDSEKLAVMTADLLHRWNRERPAQPIITAQPAGTPDDQLPHGHHIDKPDSRLTIVW